MPDSPRSPRRLVMVGLVALFLGVTALSVWYFTRPGHILPPEVSELPTPDPPTPDPRLVFDTPFRNVKPDIQYVGDEACAGCHQTISNSYHAHPMGRSAEYVSRTSSVERFDPSKHHTTFTSGNFELQVEKIPEGMRHRIRVKLPTPVQVSEFSIPAEIAIGSGTRGRSYLMIEGGAVWQTPMSWYGPEERWDISPGFRLGSMARRPIASACLFCHVDRVEPIPGTENRYREPLFPRQAAIGCERCHGPGELHIAERTTGRSPLAVDTSIVNPRHLSPALQSAICEQCHLQGAERVNRRGRDMYEFRPGLPFEQFVSAYVRHPEIAEANKSVGQFEQMEQSRCFTASGGKLGCISCHDPHYAPKGAALDMHYRQRCLTCHESKGCKQALPEREAKADSCIACHMPKAASSNIIHTSITDHRVPLRPTSRPTPRGLLFGSLPLIRFRDGPLSPSHAERDRDLGIALVRFGMSSKAKDFATRDDLRFLAVERLKASLTLWPKDSEAWDALATARVGRAEAPERFKAASTAVALAPESEFALTSLVEAAREAGQFDVAEETAGKLIRLNPLSHAPLVSRALAYLSSGNWAKAEADCLAALRIQPLHPEARLYLAICRHHKGDPAGGLREAETAALMESDTREQEALRKWYLRAIR